MVAACGDDDPPTTPAPTPMPPPPTPPDPEPEPEPEPPATPTGLMVSEETESSITWTWNAVEGAAGYVVQASMDEVWDDTDTVTFNGAPFTTLSSYTASDLEVGTTVYVRVAAASGTVAAPLVSDFSTHVTGMTKAPEVVLPPAPANLRQKARGSDFIEWEWDAVEGASGYQSQFSDGSTFPDGAQGRELHQGMANTSRRVGNLDPESAGYLRVRAYTGTVTEPTFGDWTAGSMLRTTEPPPAVPLDAPDNLEATDPSDNSITLEWDDVDNAESYEVEQREPGDDWEEASCGGAGNVVDEEACVASGLDAGTDYDFRVRAIPSDTVKYETSAWSDIAETRTSGTGPVEPTEPTPGGMGDLNVRWESTATGITFLWDRIADAEYETFILTSYSDDPEPCAGQTFLDKGRSTSQDVTVTAADDNAMVQGLCVRTTDKDNRRLSFAWGAPTPWAPTAGTPTVEDGETTSMTWSSISVAKDFNYSVRLVADTGRDDGMFQTDEAPTDALQKACADGRLLDDGIADVDLDSLSETVDSGISHFTGYTLCLQYSNDTGSTSWAVPVDGSGNLDEIHTTPAAPPAPRFDRGTNDGTGVNRTLVWTVPVRNPNTNVPRKGEDFKARTIQYPARYNHDDDDTTSKRTTRAPTSCEDADLTAGPPDMESGLVTPWRARDVESIVTSLDGVEVTSDTMVIPLAAQADDEDLQVVLCVRAMRSSAGGKTDGPWTIGGATTIRKQ